MDTPLSRRRFLQAAALAMPAVTLLGCHDDDSRKMLAAADDAGPLFLRNEERQFLDAAVERLIPSDAKHAGAKDAGVTTFIDRQLSGPYGMAETWYMQGPWPTGIEEQGWQSKLAPAQMYRAAIRNIQSHCQQKYGKHYETLAATQQDEVLHGLEKGHINLPDTSAKQFFQMLLHNTQEGFLADPMYGGNRNFAGWKLVGFPGPRYNYVDEIEQYGKPYTLPTIGLKGRIDPSGSGNEG